MGSGETESWDSDTHRPYLTYLREQQTSGVAHFLGAPRLC